MPMLKYLRLAERFILVSLMLAMVTLFFFNVLIREFGGQWASNFAWIEEAVRIMNVFVVFGALGLALERGRHVSIDTLREKLISPYRSWVLSLINLSGLIFCFYLTRVGYQMIKLVLMTGQRSPTLDIPMGWIYLAPTVGFGLLGLRFLLRFFEQITSKTDGKG